MSETTTAAIEPALTVEQIKAMPLVERMLHIQADLGRVPKHGRNEMQGYAYLRESDLVAEVVKVAFAYRVLVVFYQDTDETIINTELKTKKGDAATGTLVLQRYDLINIDEPADRLSTLLGTKLASQGYSVDNGDKSLYKAKTGAKKYALTDAFMVSSGDDPELPGAGDGDPDQRRQSQPQGRNRGGRQQAPQADPNAQCTQAQVELWVNRQKSAKLPVSAAVASLARAIGRDNLTLKPADVVEFLRTLTNKDMNLALQELQKAIREHEKPVDETTRQQPPADAPATGRVTVAE
jgi:hypothetical protein